MTIPLGAARIYTQGDLKGNLVIRVTNPITTGGAEALVGGDPERVVYTAWNLSANDMYVGFTQDVSATNGMLLGANGGYITLHVTEDYEMVALPLYIYSLAAGNQLYVTQLRRQTQIVEG